MQTAVQQLCKTWSFYLGLYTGANAPTRLQGKLSLWSFMFYTKKLLCVQIAVVYL